MKKKKKNESQKEASLSVQQAKEKNVFEIIMTPNFREHCQYWLQQDPKTLRKIFDLIESTSKDPFKGIGKPEPFKYKKLNLWSRRIDEANRFVYEVDKNKINLLQCRFHYDE